MSDNPQKPPSYLTPATRRWFKQIVTDYDLEGHHWRLLVLASESWDECQKARAAIRKHGQTFVDRYGQPRERPEVSTARQSRALFAKLLRELGLDVSEPAAIRPTMRPGGQRY